MLFFFASACASCFAGASSVYTGIPERHYKNILESVARKARSMACYGNTSCGTLIFALLILAHDFTPRKWRSVLQRPRSGTHAPLETEPRRKVLERGKGRWQQRGVGEREVGRA